MSDHFDPSTAPAASAPAHAPAPPLAAAPTRRKWITPALALVAALAVGLAGGVLIGHATAASAQASGGGFARGLGGGGQGFGGGGGGDGFAGGGFTSGTIVSINGSTIVVKSLNGTEKTVTTTSTTKVTKTAPSSVSALKAGETVTVVGTVGANGDVTATSMAEGASLRQFARPGGANGGANGGTATTGTNG
jgi:hypothetical protein